MKPVYKVALAGLVLAFAAVFFWPRKQLPPAYCAERKVSIWNRVAQVREPVATLSYGEKVGILEQRRENYRVRTENGAEGWIDRKYLMTAELWERGQQLRAQAAGRQPYARATTKVATNVRVDPGREGSKLYQFPSDVQVEVLERRVVEVASAPAPGGSQPGEAESSAEAGTGAVSAAFPEKRREDWLLIRGVGADGEITGWVLGRFLSLDYPAPLRDYAAGIRFVSWFELTATPSTEGPRPTFVAFGLDAPEGHPCDFTLLRVYTWNPKRRRYETAYVEGDLCGRLPAEVRRSADVTQEAIFRFRNVIKKGEEVREYRSRQNVVRRIRK